MKVFLLSFPKIYSFVRFFSAVFVLWTKIFIWVKILEISWKALCTQRVKIQLQQDMISTFLSFFTFLPQNFKAILPKDSSICKSLKYFCETKASNLLLGLSDCNGTRTHNHLVYKRTLNHLAKLAKWLSCVVSTYLYSAFDCMFLSCHVGVLILRVLIYTFYYESVT